MTTQQIPLTLSESVEQGLQKIESQGEAAPSVALFDTTARAVLRAQGERHPPRSLVNPLSDAMWREWNYAQLTKAVGG